MKKGAYLFIVILFVFLAPGCKENIPIEIPWEPTKTATTVITAASTSMNTATVTLTGTITWTPTDALTSTETPAVTPTSTATITPTPLGTCFYTPRLVEFGEGGQPKYFSFTLNNTITARTLSDASGKQFNYGIYDGANALIDSGSITSSTGGYYGQNYYIKGTESTANKWLFILLPYGITPPSSFTPGADIFPSTEIYDDGKFYVMVNPPTPTATPACMDMPVISASGDFCMQKYRYKLSNCAPVFYMNRWPSVTPANVGWYDGANNLVYAQSNAAIFSGICNSGVMSVYYFTGAEACGVWHVVLFNTSTAPPGTYTTGLPACGQTNFIVEAPGSPVSYP